MDDNNSFTLLFTVDEEVEKVKKVTKVIEEII
jgi:hypothetical protein